MMGLSLTMLMSPGHAVFVCTALTCPDPQQSLLSPVALKPSLQPLPGAEWRIQHRIHACQRGNESQVRGSRDA